MKKFAFLTIIALGMVSCDLLNVDIDTDISGVLKIDVDESMAKSATSAYPFSAWKTLDPQDNEDIKKYADNIVAVGVGGVEAEVMSVSKDDVLILAGTVFTVRDGSETAKWILDEDWPIKVGKTYSMDDVGGFYDDVSAILKDVGEFEIGLKGNSSQSGVTISLKINIAGTITGSLF